MNLKIKKTTIWIAAIVIIAAIVVFAALFISKKQKKLGEQPKNQIPKQEKQEKPVSLTQEEIQEVMNRKVPEAERTPLSDEEINEIMNAEVPEAERTPLSDEEIQEILNRNN